MFKHIQVSTLLDREYGETDVVLNAEGVKEVVEIDMTTEELEKFKLSNKTIKEYIKKLDN